MFKKVIAALVYITIGIGIGHPPLLEESDNSMTTYDKAVVSKMKTAIESERGELVGAIIPGKLHVDYGYPLENVTVINFVNTLTKDNNGRVQLLCDGRRQSLEVQYTITEQGYATEGAQREFSIRHYAKGTQALYESDEAREPVFSTNRGDVELRLGLESINSLPDDDLISLVMEEQDQDSYSSFGVAYSPSYTVKQFKQAISRVDLSDCTFVRMANSAIKA